MTIDEYITLEHVATPEVVAQMKEQGKPTYLFDRPSEWRLLHWWRTRKQQPVRVPDTLNGLTYGELIELQMAGDIRTFIATACRVVLGVEDLRRVFSAEAAPMVGFANWVASEVERIDGLFRALERPLTAEQLQAGYGNLHFGLFGSLDWFAKRMGITNHDEVLAVKWTVIYKVKEHDVKVAECDERYSKIMQAKNERKGRK